MIRRFFLLLTLAPVVLFLLSARTVHADGPPGALYVDTSYTGTEDGTESHPYNTLQEGIMIAQAQPGGAWIHLKQTDGSWRKIQYVRSTVSDATGVPLTSVVLYSALAVLSLILILAGWQLQRRSREQKDP